MMSEYIKRDDAVKALHDLWREFYIRDEDVDSDTECFCGGILTASHTIAKLPPADVIEHKRGEWIEKSRILYNDYGHYYYRECSLCGYEREDDNPDNDTNFCPNCGARMKGADDELV